MTGPLFAAVSDREAIDASPLTPSRLRGLLDLLESGQINRTVAVQVFEELFDSPDEDAAAIVKRKGLGKVGDEGAIREIVRAVMAQHAQAVSDFRGGKTAAKGRLVGATMKALAGRGDATVVNKVLDEELQG